MKQLKKKQIISVKILQDPTKAEENSSDNSIPWDLKLKSSRKSLPPKTWNQLVTKCLRDYCLITWTIENTVGVKEVIVDRFKDKEKEKEKVRDLIRQSPYGQLLRQASPQELDNFNQNGTYKIYVQGGRRKFKLQQNIVKN